MDVTPALIASTALSAGPPSVAMPDALATARFNALMQTPLPPSASISNPPAPTASEGAIVGERILQGLQSVSSELQSTWKSVQTGLDSAATTAMSMQELLRLQLQLVQVSVQYDFVGKAVSRSTQNLDQLVRVQ